MYEEIRPYNDAEASEALKRVADHPLLRGVSKYLFPEADPTLLAGLLKSVNSVDEFQAKVMSIAVEGVIKKTMTSFTYSGLDSFMADSNGNYPRYLIVSNHRDIVLDSALIQIILFRNSIPLTEIAVGDNLISQKFIEDLIRSNRMVKVTRGATVKEAYQSSKILSEYLRKRVVNQESSIWIAQRNGRTKDGYDITEQGLLKMLNMSGQGDFASNFKELKIIPAAISYEFEPCDILKAIESYKKKNLLAGEKYVKAENEDLNSIITGIIQGKGSVNITFCEPISVKEIEIADEFEKNVKFQRLGEIIDKKIHQAYKLTPNNYIAYDMLKEESSNSLEFTLDNTGKYTEEQKDIFFKYLEKRLAKVNGDMDVNAIRKYLLEIYANPLINSMKY